MGTPKNCRECEPSHSCRAGYYGGSLCEHKDAIYRATIGKMTAKEKEEQHHEKNLD